MRLKNILIVVNDIEVSKRFYKDLFGLEVLMDSDGNAILTEGLVLQDKRIWESCINQSVSGPSNDTVLYFVEPDIEGFVKKLDDSPYDITYIHKEFKNSWGRQIVRIYDPDGHMIEIGGGETNHPEILSNAEGAAEVSERFLKQL